MLSTIILAVTFIGLLLVSAVLWALFLWVGLRWAKVPGVTTLRLVFTTVVATVLQIAVSVLSLFCSPASDAHSIILCLVLLAVGVIVPCMVISSVFGTRFLRACQAWLPTLLGRIIAVALSLIAVRPFLYEPFVLPTNSMAPTLVGNHCRGVCSECGEPNYGSPVDDRYRRYGSPEPSLMICDNFHVTETLDAGMRVRSGDRFMVAKFLTPRRWDLVVFQYPGHPATLYLKRLVGLPGEEIQIEDGSVWADGKRLTPPESIRGIEYLSQMPGRHGSGLWGSVDRPAVLGDDEYFVLGDFSARAKDSRLWEEGAPGHNTFAVPESYMRGVVTHTYWPPDRWRIHR